MPFILTIYGKIVKHLNYLSLGKKLDKNIKMLLIAEYRRHLSHYSLTNRQLSQKYQMSFEEFERQEITKKQAYTLEVEYDAITWETAIYGLDTIQRQLAEIEE